MKIKELPDAEKPIFKLKYFGAAMLSNAELVQVITGVKDMDTASRIIAACDDPVYFHKMTMEEFEQVNGVGEATAGRIVAAMELTKRAIQTLPSRNIRIYSADCIYDMFKAEFLGQYQEKVIALLLNAKYNVLAREAISKGGIVAAHVEPRDVFRAAVKRGATGIILVHNHPSGDPTPSDEDIYATKRISQCGDLIGIKLIDHIIVGHSKFRSMRDMGLMEFGDVECYKNVAERKDGDAERSRERIMER